MRILFLIAGSIFYLLSQNNESLPVESPAEAMEEVAYGGFSETTEEDSYTLEENEYSGQYDEDDSFTEDENGTDESYYEPDNNPVTWDEDPDNYPLESPDTYINVDGDEVQSPTQYNAIPEGACAICADGTYSFSRNRRGTCSHHGGVAEWLR